MSMLSHLKILDFSTLLPGPFATLMLADLGADVLHVQKPTNAKGTVVDQYLNRSKKSITLDLKQPAAIEKVKELISDYDIILEQFRPGVMKRLGLGYEELVKVNPSLIYCSLTGYGQTGPLKDRPGHDINYLAMAGLASYSGTLKGGPANNATQIADIAGGSMHAVIGILSAYIYREQTGKGQYLDISMMDCSFTMNALWAPGYFNGGQNLESEMLLLNGGTFYGHYQTKDHRYFSVGSLEPQFRKELCKGIGREDLFDLSLSNKKEDVQLFKEIVKDTFLTKTFDEWRVIFNKIEACVEPVLTFAEVCEHPQTTERGLIAHVPTQNGGYQKQIGFPIKSSVFTPEYKHIGLNPGDNNDKVLGTKR